MQPTLQPLEGEFTLEVVVVLVVVVIVVISNSPILHYYSFHRSFMKSFFAQARQEEVEKQQTVDSELVLLALNTLSTYDFYNFNETK